MRVHYLQRAEQKAVSYLPMLCMHCEDAPCMAACDSAALQRAPDGRIVVDEKRCDGRQTCVTACPYGAISMHPTTGKAEKCDFCVERTTSGLAPACVEACPTDALRWGDQADASSPVSKEMNRRNAIPYSKEAGRRPGVRYAGQKPWTTARTPLVRLTKGEDGLVYE